MIMVMPLGMGKLGLKPVSSEPDYKDDPSLPLEERITNVIKTVFDPEIPVNIFELGLIYNIKINDDKDVHIDMTLTSPACPVAGSMPRSVEEKVAALPGVKSAKVELVWDPPWTQERMSEAAKLELGFF
ncbi:MAG: SUF system Fe-S cluster assembly protein [Gemmatales bacterium]